MTALMWAAYWGRTVHIQMLLEAGADIGVNMRSAFGQTALFWAVEKNQSEVISTLTLTLTLTPF